MCSVEEKFKQLLSNFEAETQEKLSNLRLVEKSVAYKKNSSVCVALRQLRGDTLRTSIQSPLSTSLQKRALQDDSNDTPKPIWVDRHIHKNFFRQTNLVITKKITRRAGFEGNSIGLHWVTQ